MTNQDQFDLNEIAIFVRVVDAGSFTGAAKGLGLPKSTVSRKITQLEERLGVRLLQRTTRTLSLTDTGQAYYSQCAQIINEIEEANLAVTELQSSPAGTIRLTAPNLLGEFLLAPLVAEFLEEYPKINIEMRLTDQVLDLIQEGLDLAFRHGELEDSSLIARQLGEATGIAVASPEYLKKYGTPKHPDDIQEHAVITYQKYHDWEFLREGEVETVRVNPRVETNDIIAMLNLALNGAGIARLPAFLAVDHINQNRLVHVLNDWDMRTGPLHILYPSNRHLSVKVRSFVDFIIDRIRNDRSWITNPKEIQKLLPSQTNLLTKGSR